jgi:16S rRNA G527 N7-methylase RsmG
MSAILQRALDRYAKASRKWNTDCNLRALKKPDSRRQKLEAQSARAFAALTRAMNRPSINQGRA